MSAPTELMFLDLETQGLSLGCNIVAVGVMNAAGVGLVKNYYEVDRGRLQDALLSHLVVVHNASFDIRVLRENGFAVPYYIDTMVLSYCLDTRGHGMSHSLAAWGNYLECPKMGSPVEDDSEWETLEYTEELAEYCLQDLVVLKAVYDKLLVQCDEHVWDVYWTLDHPLIDAIIEMERTGILLDVPKLQEASSKILMRIAALDLLVRENVGLMPGKEHIYKKGSYTRNGETKYDHCELEVFNPNSDEHVRVHLARLGVELEKTTDTGKLSVDKFVLGDLVNNPDPVVSSFVSTMVELNQYSTIQQTFLTAFESKRDVFGRLRCSFNQCVTLTGRLSSSKPNLQNLPARGELGEMIRSLVIAPEGKKLISIDLSNIEGRVVAHYLSKVMGDTRMADSFYNGLDFHAANQASWGLETRAQAKTLLYAFVYGASATKLGGGDKKVGKALMDSLQTNMPALVELKQKIVASAIARQRPHIVTLYGRKIYYPDLWSSDRALRARAERQVVNALIQGSAADILKDLLNQSVPIIHKYGGTLLLQVHDELLMEVPEENAQALAAELTELFSHCPRLTHCPISGEAKVGNNWQDIH